MYYLDRKHRPIPATEIFNLESVPSLPNVKDRRGVPRRRTHVPKLIQPENTVLDLYFFFSLLQSGY
jgi:hypothetical protein